MLISLLAEPLAAVGNTLVCCSSDASKLGG